MMKIILPLLIVALLYACQSRNRKNNIENVPVEPKALYKSNKPNTTINGSIINAPENYVILSQDAFYDTIDLSGDGVFEIKLHLQKAEYFLLRNGKSNIRLFLEPNYNLNISFDANNTFKTIEFNGSGKAANTYLKDKYLLMLNHALSFSDLYNMNAEAYRYQVDSLYVISKMFYDEMVEKTNLPEIFKETELASLKYERGTHLLEYVANNNHEVNYGEQYFNFMNELTVDSSKYLPIYEFRLYLNAFIDMKANKKILGKNLAPYEIALTKMQTINAHIKNQKVKDYLLYSYLKQHVKYYGYKNAELLFKTFELNCKNQQYLNTALTSYNEYKSLAEVKQAPNFKMEDVSGKNVNLKDFKGAYIYIDVWASWCLPCRKEAPIFEKLKHEYSHKNIVFLSLSIDKTKEDWIGYLKNKNLDTDMHFLAKDKKSFLDSYMIQTIPHFLIIDDKGNLIDNNAARPSEGKTEWLDDLPEKKNV